MRKVETEGRTLEEALQRASLELGVVLEAVEYEVISQRKKLLGILGKQRVRIRAWSSQTRDPRAKDFLTRLLGAAGLSCEVTAAGETEDGLTLELGGRDTELLLKRDGELLDALQHLTEKAINRGEAHRRRVFLDCDGFRRSRENELRESAIRAARQALREGSAALGPLNARDRRIVHMALKDRPGIVTRSVGEGPLRRVLISREPPGNRGGARREVT